MPDTEPTTTCCLIGAGAAGLAMGKALVERGIDVDWFEAGGMVGGLWQIDNDNGTSAAYQTLHLNSSRPLTQYPSFPMPSDWPDYPSHTMMARYFDSFADRFDLRRRITFHTTVTAVAAQQDGTWSVTTGDGRTRRYRHVLVANGHHSVPKLPDLPGTFTGTVMHSHDYRDPAVFDGQRVLVLGVGNSGMDLAVDASRRAERTFLATRHGVHVIPKYAFGKPIDQLNQPWLARLPFAVERGLYEVLIRLSAGTPRQRGLPQPDHRLLGAHPTVSAELYDRVGHGDIVMKPGIERLDGEQVVFADGSRETVDLLVYATGYQVALPFLDRSILDCSDNRMRLYQRVVDPGHPGLWFIGFIQTVGSGIPLYEYQAQWVADVIAGDAELPPAERMRRWIAADQRALAKRYVRSTRHTMQVDYWRYINALRAERRRRPSPRH